MFMITTHEIIEELSKILKNVTFESKMVTKPGDVEKTGIIIKREGTAMAPILYIEEFMAENDTAEAIAQAMAEAYLKIDQPTFNADEILTRDYIKENVVFRVVNTAKNLSMLRSLIKWPYLNTSLIPIVNLTISNKDASFKITEELAEKLEISKEELYAWCYYNTEQTLRFMSMSDIFEEMGISHEEATLPEMQPPFIIGTNDERAYGASMMLYTDKIRKAVGAEPGDEVIILPSSVHEVLIINTAAKNDVPSHEELQQMVKDVNEREVSDEDFLSNEIYFMTNSKLHIY